MLHSLEHITQANLPCTVLREGVFTRVPMLRRVWNKRRAQNGDTYIKHIMVLQRCVATHRFVSCVKHAVKIGKKARATKAARTELTQQLRAADALLEPEVGSTCNIVPPGSVLAL